MILTYSECLPTKKANNRWAEYTFRTNIIKDAQHMLLNTLGIFLIDARQAM